MFNEQTDIDENVSYIVYRDEDNKKQLWRISPVTKIAEFIPVPEEPTKYFTRCSKEAGTELEIDYITEYLLSQGYCEFEREGDQIFFKHYDDDSAGTIMKNKYCQGCGDNCIINLDQDTCNACKTTGMVEVEQITQEEATERVVRRNRWAQIAKA
jgi:hypothetical protein